MAVTRKAAAVAAQPDKIAEDPRQPGPTPSFAYVRLINGCSTYVTPAREVFYAKNADGSKRVYEIDAKDLTRIIGYKDDYNRKFFKQVNAPTEEDVARTENILKMVKTGAGDDDDKTDDFDGEDDELGDTGIMRLRDGDGKPAGVNV